MRIALAVTSILTLVAPIHAQSFFGLGALETPDGLGRTDVGCISADGLTVFGHLNVKNGTSPAFRWTAAGGLESIGAAFGGDTTYPTGASADGAVIVGYTGGGAGFNTAWRWTAGAGFTNLCPLLLDEDAVADAVSADGSFVAGSSISPNHHGYRVVRWDKSGLIQDIGVYPGDEQSLVRATTSDGRIIVGWTTAGGLDGMAPYRWTDSKGWELIPMAPGVNGASPNAIIADGSVVAGVALGEIGEQAFRWTQSGGMQLLGVPLGAESSHAFGISADGNTIVGLAGGLQSSGAFLWTPALGMLDLKAHLTSLGLNLDDWLLGPAEGISADGFTIIGTGMHNGEQEAWVAVIPAPASTFLLVAPCFFRRRRA